MRSSSNLGAASYFLIPIGATIGCAVPRHATHCVEHLLVSVAEPGKQAYPSGIELTPMRRLLLLALATVTIVGTLTATACEKHMNGHQNGSDTDVEGSKR